MPQAFDNTPLDMKEGTGLANHSTCHVGGRGATPAGVSGDMGHPRICCHAGQMSGHGCSCSGTGRRGRMLAWHQRTVDLSFNGRCKIHSDWVCLLPETMTVKHQAYKPVVNHIKADVYI